MTVPANKPEGWTLEDLERGLTALVLCRGSARNAERLLQDAGHPAPSYGTLERWKKEDPQRYEQTREKLVPVIERKIAQEAEDLALQIAESERALIEALSPDKIAQMKGKDLANAAKALATAKALNLDKVQGPLRGRPVVIEHKHSATELLDRLAARIGSAVDSTADDITDAHELEA